MKLVCNKGVGFLWQLTCCRKRIRYHKKLGKFINKCNKKFVIDITLFPCFYKLFSSN